jgi:6-phosphogluconolactonase
MNHTQPLRKLAAQSSRQKWKIPRGLCLVAGWCITWVFGQSTTTACQDETLKEDRLTLLVGTYTNKDSQGVYRLELNPATGQLTQGGLVAKLDQPSFLAASPGLPGHFAAVHETADFSGSRGGGLSLLKYHAETGTAEVVSQSLTQGGAPCHVVMDSGGGRIAVANYSGGSYSGYRLHRGSDSPEQTHEQASADGFPGLTRGFCFQHSGSSINKQRQESSHGHCVRFVPGHEDMIVAADLGTDEVLVFKVSETKADLLLEKINTIKLKLGSGPRQIDFHPNGKWMYVINELDSTISQLTLPDSQGNLQLLGTVPTLPADFQGSNGTAQVQVHPNGRFVYGSNRGHNSIAMFSVDVETGALTPLGHEATGIKTPRHFLVEPSGRYLLVANQDADSVVVFPISPETGVLEKSQFQAHVPTPVCLLPLN